MAGGAVPRADSILLVRANYYEVLYSYMRSISAYSNSDRASSIRLEATSFEEMDCPRCYTYKMQELDSYNYDPYLPHTTSIFYSSFTIERRIPGKMVRLKIWKKRIPAVSARQFDILYHLEFRHPEGTYIERTYTTEYMSTTVFYVLV